MPTYQARYGKSRKRSYRPVITSVLADDIVEARREIRRQLNKPGREEYLRRWLEDGEQVNLKRE